MSMVANQKHVAKRQCRRARSLWKRAKVSVPHVSTSARQAFTLVELLVVIGILAILAALITPAIFQARVSARNAAIKAEIDMLHMAIMNYKNEYGSFPPCASDTDPSVGDARLRRHLSRSFPRADLTPTATVTDELFKPYAVDGIDNDGDGFVDESDETNDYIAITPGSALAFFLAGYTNSPTSPIKGGQRKKLYDFDATRIDNNSGSYHPAGKKGSPYIYIDSSEYTWDADGNPATPEVIQTFGVYFAQRWPLATDFSVPAQPAFNPDTFQILCAGLDEQWGTGDDLSNFWKGTRQDYLDSLE